MIVRGECDGQQKANGKQRVKGPRIMADEAPGGGGGLGGLVLWEGVNACFQPFEEPVHVNSKSVD